MNKIGILLLTVLVIGAHADEPEKEQLVGAEAAKIGEFPYQVSLKLYGTTHFCAGALIDKKHILTAAHCIYAARKALFGSVYAVVGTNTISYGGKSYRVVKMDPHPGFVDSENPDWSYDIGILTLNKVVTLSKLVNTVDLPKKDVIIGSEAISTGWGDKYFSGSGLSVSLQKLTLKIVDNDACRRKLARHGTVDDSHICTFVKRGKGTCSGDSGGPLVQDGIIIGVVSGGIPCAVGYPDVFSKVYKYLDFIKQITEEH